MGRKIKIGISIIVVLLGLQWLAIKMVYAHKLEGPLAQWVATVYSLKAGVVERDGDSLVVYLSDYLDNQALAGSFLQAQAAQFESQGTDYVAPSDEDLSEIIWDKLLKDAWLNNISTVNDLAVTDSEMEEYLAKGDDLDALKESSQRDFGLSFDKYQKLVIEPFILEAKVYEFILSSYQDTSGVKQAEAAYTALELGLGFDAAAAEFSDDKTYVDNSLYLAKSELVDFYEPIASLSEGQYSSIVILPGAYIIWYLQSIIEDSDGNDIYEIKAITINAKILQDFLDEYLINAEIIRLY